VVLKYQELLVITSLRSHPDCKLVVSHDDYSLTSKLPRERTSVVTITGLMNNSYFDGAHEVLHYVTKHSDLGRIVLEVAKEQRRPPSSKIVSVVFDFEEVRSSNIMHTDSLNKFLYIYTTAIGGFSKHLHIHLYGNNNHGDPSKYQKEKSLGDEMTTVCLPLEDEEFVQVGHNKIPIQASWDPRILCFASFFIAEFLPDLCFLTCYFQISGSFNARILCRDSGARCSLDSIQPTKCFSFTEKTVYISLLCMVRWSLVGDGRVLRWTDRSIGGGGGGGR
ncbi:hypothetical protein ACJX0J_019746, partial [Zea mays]